MLASSSVGAQVDGADEPARTRAPRDEDRLRRISVTVNPLGAVVGRWGGNVEVVPARHHALIASGYVQTFSLSTVKSLVPDVARERLRDDAPSVAGGEVGYRLYSGRTGANGVFIGPSFVVMPLAYPRLARDLVVELQPFHAVGGAIDVGAQAITPWGLTVGGGFGAMLLSYELPNDDRRLPLAFAPRVLPRVLLTAGWSF